MEALIFLVALVSLGLLAMRFGADSRSAIRSDEHRLAASGVAWDPDLRPTESNAAITPPPMAGAEGAATMRLVRPQSGNTSTSYPTLQAIDLARDPGQTAFATDSDAALLEQRARQLIDQHWSELVWHTGLVDQARFDAVCDALERERQALMRAGQGIDVFVLPEQAARAAD